MNRRLRGWATTRGILGWSGTVLLALVSASAVVYGTTIAYGRPPTADAYVGALPGPAEGGRGVAYAWRTQPVDGLFPETLEGGYGVTHYAFVTWHRVGVAEPAPCRAALDAHTLRRLDAVGCRFVLRATYVDDGWTHAASVGVVVVDDVDAFEEVASDGTLTGDVWSGRAQGLLPAAFPGTPADGFGARQRFGTEIGLGPEPTDEDSGTRGAPGWLYAVSVGFADGRSVEQRSEVAGKKGELIREVEGLARSFASKARQP